MAIRFEKPLSCDHHVEQFYNVGSERKKIGTLSEEDLDFLIAQSHPGFDCQEEDITTWICKNEDIRILNEMGKLPLDGFRES
jgi:hypothetical protein